MRDMKPMAPTTLSIFTASRTKRMKTECQVRSHYGDWLTYICIALSSTIELSNIWYFKTIYKLWPDLWSQAVSEYNAYVVLRVRCAGRRRQNIAAHFTYVLSHLRDRVRRYSPVALLNANITFTYRAFVFLTVWEVAGRWEFLANDHRGSEQKRLSNAHNATGRVVKRQRCVEDVVRLEIGYVMNAGRDENISRMRDNGCLWQSRGARCVNVQQLTMMGIGAVARFASGAYDYVIFRYCLQ